MKSDIWGGFTKSVEKIQVSLKSDKNNGYFTDDQYTLLITSRSVLLRMRNVSEKRWREDYTHTHFMFINVSFSKIVTFM